MKATQALVGGGILLATVTGAAAADRVGVGPVPLIGAAPAVTPPVSGEIGVFAGGSQWRWAGFGSPTDGTVTVFGAEGKVNLWLNPAWSLQFDASTEGTSPIDLDGTPDSDGRSQSLLGGHISWRSPYHLLGAFAAVSTNNNLPDRGDMSHSILGIEGQMYLNAATFYFQGGSFNLRQGSNNAEPTDLLFARAAVRFFLSPNTMLSAEFAHATGRTQEPDYWANISAWRVEVEHLFAGTPWAVFARFDGNHAFSTYDPEDGASRENQIVGGVKVMFGQPSLLARDRRGATLDLPSTIVRALPYSYVWYY